MTIWWPTILICAAAPMTACYLTIPWFREAVKRRLTLKPLDYDALDEILVEGLPDRLTIECLQASYTANAPHIGFVDIYPHKEGVAVVRFLVDDRFPIASIFHSVLIDNYNALGMKSNKAPVIAINHSVYRVTDFEYDSTYLLIYVKHQ